MLHLVTDFQRLEEILIMECVWIREIVGARREDSGEIARGEARELK